jgi:hypothetical protein
MYHNSNSFVTGNTTLMHFYVFATFIILTSISFPVEGLSVLLVEETGVPREKPHTLPE